MARTQGLELIERLNDGRTQVAPSEFLQTTRDEVSAALEELIEVGARIRPLLVGKRRVGWVRGIHLTERRALRRWVSDEVEFVEILLTMATTAASRNDSQPLAGRAPLPIPRRESHERERPESLRVSQRLRHDRPERAAMVFAGNTAVSVRRSRGEPLRRPEDKNNGFIGPGATVGNAVQLSDPGKAALGGLHERSVDNPPGGR